MWIAIQHLYGMYTDFKKTINPIQYYDSNNNDEFDCDGSIMSARMADRPPVKKCQVYIFKRDYILRPTMRVRGKITNKLSRRLFSSQHMSYLHIPNKFKPIPNQHKHLISKKLLPYTALQ